MKIRYIKDWRSDSPLKGDIVDEEFDTGLDIANHMAVVHSKIKKTVSPDFVMAKFDEKNKEFVIEMIGNAYYARNVLRSLILRLEEKIRLCEKFRPNDESTIKKYKMELNMVQETQDILFTTYTTKVQMVAVVNRNVANNYLMEILSGFRKDSEEVVADGITGTEKIKEYLGNLMKPDNESM